jgi:putative heme-binding domain-containing protein
VIRNGGALADVLAALDKPATPAPAQVVQRPFVKQWTMADFDAFTISQRAGDRARGGRLFTELGCAQMSPSGKRRRAGGADLTAVGARFDRRALLESVIEPSRVIADVYRGVTISTKSGAIHDGRIVSEDAKSVTLATNPADPDHREHVSKQEIVSRRVSDVSAMPEGLLNTLNRGRNPRSAGMDRRQVRAAVLKPTPCSMPQDHAQTLLKTCDV